MRFSSHSNDTNVTPSSILDAYQALLAARSYTADAAQLAGVRRLDALAQDLVAFEGANKNTFKIFFSKPPIPRGVWLWGGVGRGKSFVMDCFYAAVPTPRKTRIHFHEFMRSVHHQIALLKGRADPLDEVAKGIANKYALLCFDEFHVSDVADAMILHRLLSGLFKHGVVFVMTSNYVPDKLYPDGLHRDRVLPAIALLKQNLDVLNLDAGIDYRKLAMTQVQAYWSPNDAAAMNHLTAVFDGVAECADEVPVLHIENRDIQATRKAGGAVWFSFDQLCAGPRSQNDYLDMATVFHTVVLTGVPQLKPSQSAQARRLTWLIDVFYDHKVKLLIAADCAADALYLEGQFANEFHRTVSRIIEMQSKDYLDAERRSIVTL